MRTGQIKVRDFKGLDLNRKSPLIIDQNNTQDCHNIVLNVPRGTLNNQIGYQKFNNIKYNGSIDYLIQLKKHGYVNVDTTNFSLLALSTYFNE